MKKSVCTVIFAMLLCMVGGVHAAATKGNPYKTAGNPFAIINAETDELYASVESLDERVTITEQSINELYASVESLEERVTIAEQGITELEKKADDLQQQILFNDGDIASLRSELIVTNKMIYKLQTDLAKLQAVVALKQNIIQGKCPDNQYISEIRPDGSLVCQLDAGANGLRRFIVYNGEYLKACLCLPWEPCSCSTRPSGTISATCPAGSLAIGGGHSADLTVDVGFSGLRGNSWSVDAWLYPLFMYSGGYVSVHATCIGLN